MKHLTVTVPGKIILSGEHSVVYGYPAVVAAIDRVLTLSVEFQEDILYTPFAKILKEFPQIGVVEVANFLNSSQSGLKNVTLQSEIPVGCGMGSSAAFAAAVSFICLYLAKQPYDRENINHHAFLLEKQAHTNPSGIDNTIVVHGGVIKYQKNADGTTIQESLKLPRNLENIFALNTGKPQESTAEMVQIVRSRLETDPQTHDALQKIGAVTEQILDRLLSSTSNPKSLGLLFQKNQHLLEKIGVVGADAQKRIRSLEKNGIFAKISGAGGSQGESGIIIAYQNKREYRDTDFFPLQIHQGLTHEIHSSI